MPLSKRSIKPLVLLAAAALTACASRVPQPLPSAPEAIQSPAPAVDAAAKKSYAKALAAMKAGRVGQAQAMLSEMVRQYPQLAGPYANLGLLHLRAGRLQEAEQAFREAIARKPDEARYYNHLGIVYRRAGRFDEARAAYEQALVVDADYADAHLNLGILCDLYLADYSAAKKHYLRAKQLLPDPQQVSGWLFDLEKRAQVSN